MEVVPGRRYERIVLEKIEARLDRIVEVFGVADFGIVMRTGLVVANAGQVSHDHAGGDGRRLLRKRRAIFLDGRVEIELARSQSCIAAIAVSDFEIEARR